MYSKHHVGYMFGGVDGANSNSKTEAQTNETPSEIKTALEEWYEKNIYETNYHEYIADEIFCNDRSIPGTENSGSRKWRME